MSVDIKLKWDEAKAVGRVTGRGSRAIRDVAQALLDESKKQVPHNEGILEASGTVDSDGLAATVSYGDNASAPYAVRWHENRANFQRGRKWKYLEDPCNDPIFRDRALRYIAQQIKL